MEKEEFLMRLTGSEEEQAAASSPRLQYYNKVPTSDERTLKMEYMEYKTENYNSFYVI